MKVKHISSENGHTYVIDPHGNLFYLEQARAYPVEVVETKVASKDPDQES